MERPGDHGGNLEASGEPSHREPCARAAGQRRLRRISRRDRRRAERPGSVDKSRCRSSCCRSDRSPEPRAAPQTWRVKDKQQGPRCFGPIRSRVPFTGRGEAGLGRRGETRDCVRLRAGVMRGPIWWTQPLRAEAFGPSVRRRSARDPRGDEAHPVTLVHATHRGRVKRCPAGPIGPRNAPRARRSWVARREPSTTEVAWGRDTERAETMGVHL